MCRITLVLLALMTAVAHAEGDVGVVVTGEPTMGPPITAQLEDWLRKHGHRIEPKALPPDAINTIIDCFVIENEDCARAVVDKRSKTRSVVYAKSELRPKTDDGEPSVTLIAYWFEKGREAIARTQVCERCTDLTLRGAAEELMTTLAAARQDGTGHLKLTSSPVGARVRVNGAPVGVTPLDYDLEPGNQQITVDADRYQVEARDVAIRVGETVSLDFPLRERAGAKPRSRALPVALVAVGGAAIVTGAILFAIDEDPSAQGQFQIRNTAPAGVGIASAGAVISAIGVYLLWSRAPRSTSTPIAVITPDAAFAGWAGQF